MHEPRRLSCDHDEGVEATWDAIAALTKSSSSFLTLSQRRLRVRGPHELDAEQRDLRLGVVDEAPQARNVDARRGAVLAGLRGTDAVANPSPFTHATRGRSCGRIDGVTVASRRVDAIDAKFNFAQC